MKLTRVIPLFALAVASCTSTQPHQRKPASEPALTIRAGDKIRTFTRSELLTLPNTKPLTTTHDPVYPGQTRVYKAVPAAVLFAGLTIKPDETLYFDCVDGFSAPLSSQRLLNTDPNASTAYIAIEEATSPWPPIKPSQGPATPGPFYLIWDHPEKSKVATEEWPFQLNGFEVKASIEKMYPHIAPGAEIAQSSAIHHGYEGFLKNCFPCHTMNGEGTSQIGPDLNIPHNPTEYLGARFLWQQIRDPQKIKHWPQGRMTGFDPSVLPDQDVREIIQYLKYMARHKAKPI